MGTLIIKLNATGDVVRTTPALHRLEGHVTWITSSANVEILEGIRDDLRCLTWENRALAADRTYELVINLEDDRETAQFLDLIRHEDRFGAYLDEYGDVTYTESSRMWFDLGLVSVYGRGRADALKLQNRRAYQDLIFEGLGWTFGGEPYVLPHSTSTDLSGDVAIAPVAGRVWPNKGWSYYGELRRRLESDGLLVNVLPRRPTLREHLHDIANHHCVVSGDSLPMHLALGTGTRCVTIFNCTSPWEIHNYGLQTQIVSPLLEEFFYKRGTDRRAMSAVGVDEVYDAVMAQLSGCGSWRGVERARDRRR